MLFSDFFIKILIKLFRFSIILLDDFFIQSFKSVITWSFLDLAICKKPASDPIIENLAAISCGVIENETYLDLDYSEDLGAEVDANFVITENEKLVEIQMTSEEKLCSEDNFQQMLTIAKVGIKQLIEIQKKILSK